MSDVVWIEYFFESLEGKCLRLPALRYKVIWYSAKKYDFPLKIIRETSVQQDTSLTRSFSKDVLHLFQENI